MRKKNPHATKASIMDAAENLVLESGFGATSVDAVVRRAGVTKGAFFHHFPSKEVLGHALVDRYAERDADHLEETLRRATRLSDDPLRQVLLLVGLLEEELSDLAAPLPGCLFASYCYQSELFSEETHGLVQQALRNWRTRVGALLGDALERYPTAGDVAADDLADMLLVIFEGAFILSRTLDDAALVARQLRHYRRYLELLFGMSL
jgi:TetR/AcrR family transcriptional regulator, transcriptional repressor for nem operon